jgi:hypothetical protein
MNLPTLWRATTTRPDERKRILRLIIQEVFLDQKRSRGQVWIKILWQTGAVSEHSMPRPVQSYNSDYSDLDYLRKRIFQLNAQGLMDKQVAAALNEEGVVSARRRPFTYENVWLLRQRWGLPAVKLNPTGSNPSRWPDGSYSVQGAAAVIGVTPQVIFKYLAKGLLKGRQIAKGNLGKSTLRQNKSTSSISAYCASGDLERRHHEKLCSPKTLGQSPKARLVVTMIEERS